MKNLFKIATFLCLIITVTSCTVEPVESLDDTLTAKISENTVASSVQTCSNQNPQSRLVNNGTIPFTFKIVDSNDNMVQIQSIAPGTTSTWITFSEGTTIFSLESDTTWVSDSKLVLDMSLCTEVEIIMNSGNTPDTPTIVEII